uniref:Uncharacterized protein n=1 Tax=uncultured microorganism TaxID=358574 RepID=I2FJL9_9ZZZZ|nr:hypothetical protein [uncultured microorganism]
MKLSRYSMSFLFSGINTTFIQSPIAITYQSSISVSLFAIKDEIVNE